MLYPCRNGHLLRRPVWGDCARCRENAKRRERTRMIKKLRGELR